MMNGPTEGRILLVGEGNFSLSASLVDGGTILGPQMIATCRETFTSVQETHQLAATNIDFLEKAGATVLFEVDATDLHNHPDINFYYFDRIIFNFPLADRHNIKKNRELLSDFFSSVKNILDVEKGQVMVTLCKGQGGTPADQPMRSWHDSWQVVSMAANAGLILTQIHPFQVEEFARYKSVGFRFQDKSFHTDSALTHVFEVAPVVTVPAVSCARCVMSQGDQQFVVPPYVRRKHDRWSLLDKEGHPVCTLLHHLASHLSHTLPSLTHLPTNCPLLPKILPDHVSCLNATPCHLEEVESGLDLDDGQMGDAVMTAGADGDEESQTDGSASLGQPGVGHREHQATCSKEWKELENRQKLEARPGATPDPCMMATEGKPRAECAMSFPPFQHGVDRDGAGEDLVPTGQGPGMRDSSGLTFAPLNSPVFVLHTLPQPDPPPADHDLSSGSPVGQDGLSKSQRQPMDAGDGQTGDSMETEEGKCAASGDVVEAKKSKMDTDCPPRVMTRQVNSLFHLRCSMLENLDQLVDLMKAQSYKAVFTSGIVYCRCPIRPSEMAARHEVLVLADSENSGDVLKDQVTTALKAVMDKDTAARLSATSMTKTVNIAGKGCLDINQAFTLQTKGVHRCATLGHIFTWDAEGPPGCGQGLDAACQRWLGAVLYLDTILLHALRLPDVRLLWSEDKRFLGQFTQGASPLAAFSSFQPFSLYPVRFVHDLSFWENPQRVFEEEEFLDVVREIADDVVTCVTLVDRFDHAESGKTSRCYRLVFQSHDHALSYITSWRLQSVLRLKVAQQLGVTLR